MTRHSRGTPGGQRSRVERVCLLPSAMIRLMFRAAGVMNRGAMNHKEAAETDATSGFAIPLTESTDLGLAMLIAESEDGQYEPVGVVASISEARENAESDLKGRMRRLERGSHPGMCPYAYKVWANGIDGDYRVAIELPAASL